MMKRIILILFILLCVVGNAQTIKWLVEPKYSSINHYSEDIFKCIDNNGNLQLLDWNGKPLLPSDISEKADAVTDFSDGYAVVLQGNKILGFFSEANSFFQPLNGDYFATKYSLFSEGYIVVAQGNPEGKQGYLDSKGMLVLKCQYVEAMPVRQGWALVTETGKDPKTLPRRYKRSDDWSSEGMSKLKSGESFVWATSFNEEGFALARIKGGKYVVFDKKFNEIERNDKHKKDEVNIYDYSYKNGNSQEVVRPANKKPVRNEGYSVFGNKGNMGYQNTNGVFAPAQFTEAQDFYANRAIVSMGGYFGIVELLSGEFVPYWSKEKIRAYDFDKEVESILFELATPASLESSKIKLELDKGDGHYADCNGLTTNFSVANQVINRKSINCDLKARAVYCENGFPDLLLWEGERDIIINYISVVLGNPVTTSEYAGENDNQIIKAVVTNTSDVDVAVSATLTVCGKKAQINRELIKAKQSKTLHVSVKVDDEDKQVQATVTATVDGHSCGSKSANVSLKKI